MDNTDGDERLNKDVSDYISSRLQQNKNSSQHKCLSDSSSVDKLTKFLTVRARGCFLYVKLILDLLERGSLILKSNSFKSLPQSLSEVYLLAFNLQFPTSESYEEVAQMFSVALVQLQPVTLDTLYNIFSALHIKPAIKWNHFQDKYQLVADFLVTRSDGTLMFFHATLRDWLLGRREGETSKFVCDARLGHAATAYFLSRPLAGKISSPDSVLLLIHHLLKANVNKITETDSSYANKELQAAFVSLAADDVSDALACVKNLHSPIIKVSRLLLLSGADPNTRTDHHGESALLGVHSVLGHTDMVSLLLEYGADADMINSRGESPLMLATVSGHLDIVQLLLQCGADLDTRDNQEVSATVAAAREGHINVLEFLLHSASERTKVTRAKKLTLEEQTQQALIASISSGQLEVGLVMQ